LDRTFALNGRRRNNMNLVGEIDYEKCTVCGKGEYVISRVKDVIYGDKDWTVTIYIQHCDTCGDRIDVRE
jgi:hypothetical protein